VYLVADIKFDLKTGGQKGGRGISLCSFKRTRDWMRIVQKFSILIYRAQNNLITFLKGLSHEIDFKDVDKHLQN
jgi:hypothetical protein